MTEKSDLLKMLAPNPGRKPLLPELNPQAELALLCRVLFKEGYNDHIAGHITLKQPDGTMFINPWELAWDELTASDILKLDASGKIIDGEWNVTPAISLHVAIHAARPDVEVIIHNHTRWGTIFANAQKVPKVYDQTAAMVDGEIALIDEYGGTVDAADEAALCAEGLGENKWALLANHGVLVVANDVRQAYLRAATLEWRCRQAWHVEALGGGRPVPHEVAEGVGAMIDGNGFPFMWEAMARREIRAHPEVLD